MEFETSEEQIEYLNGRVNGLENSLISLLELLDDTDAIRLISTKIDTQSHLDSPLDSILFSNSGTEFNIKKTLSMLDLGNTIHRSTVESALAGCWQLHTNNLKPSKTR